MKGELRKFAVLEIYLKNIITDGKDSLFYLKRTVLIKRIYIYIFWVGDISGPYSNTVGGNNAIRHKTATRRSSSSYVKYRTQWTF